MDVHVHVYRRCVDAENEEEMPEIMRERDFHWLRILRWRLI